MRLQLAMRARQLRFPHYSFPRGQPHRTTNRTELSCQLRAKETREWQPRQLPETSRHFQQKHRYIENSPQSPSLLSNSPLSVSIPPAAFFSQICSFRREMEDSKQGSNNAAWMSVPAFGDWDTMKNGAVPDYSMDFSKIRENRRQNKSDFSRASLGNDEELLAAARPGRKAADGRHDDYAQLSNNSAESGAHARAHSPTMRKRISSYFVCCIGA